MLKCRCCIGKGSKISPEKLQGDFRKVVTKLIRQYLGQELCNGDVIAERLHEQKYFAAKSRSRTPSFQQLLDETRINLGLSLLRHSDMSLIQIAERLGYASSNSLCRGFKRLTGHSPGDYRKDAN